MFRQIALTLTTAALLAISPRPEGPLQARTAATDEKNRFDVSDVSYLWPVPKTEADVDALISADTSDAATGVSIWDEAAFKQMVAIVTSNATAIKHPSGAMHRITFRPEFRDRKTWKVVAFRADPSAPGAHPTIVDKFGSTPQLRLILQPVTVQGGKVKVHDFAVHLLYSYFTPREAPRVGFLTPANPDMVKFRAILDDLLALKAELRTKGIDTQGVPLGVHPGLSGGAGGERFAALVRALLLRHVNVKNLAAMACMGLDSPAAEPWIFVATVNRGDGTFIPLLAPTIGFKPAQMFDRSDGVPVVVPRPQPSNRNPITNSVNTPAADLRGVSTLALFDDKVERDAVAVANTSGVPDADGLTNKEIADLIANPEKSHFFSNDCFSCHSETTRRAILALPSSASAYKRPSGVSNVDPKVLPSQLWNVRNFGWFPDSSNAGSSNPTVAQRTANETADCVQFINRVYFGNP